MTRPADTGLVCELGGLGTRAGAAGGTPRRGGRVVRAARERASARRIRRLVPDLVWAEIEPLLPARRPTPRGGRPRSDARAALAGIVHVLRTGSSWAALPQDLGFGSGMTCWRRLREWQAAGVWPEVERALVRGVAGAERLPWWRLALSANGGDRPRPGTGGA